jgi:hypothetical protein
MNQKIICTIKIYITQLKVFSILIKIFKITINTKRKIKKILILIQRSKFRKKIILKNKKKLKIKKKMK